MRYRYWPGLKINSIFSNENIMKKYMYYSIKLCSMSSASGTFVVYLDNIDASAATDIMPGPEYLANAFISYIIWACETKKWRWSTPLRTRNPKICVWSFDELTVVNIFFYSQSIKKMYCKILWFLNTVKISKSSKKIFNLVILPWSHNVSMLMWLALCFSCGETCWKSESAHWALSRR